MHTHIAHMHMHKYMHSNVSVCMNHVAHINTNIYVYAHVDKLQMADQITTPC